MPHDLVDLAFVNRLRSTDVTSATAETPHVPRATTPPPSAEPPPATAPQSAPQRSRADARADVAAKSVADRLLESSPAEWTAVAEAVERAIADLDGSRDGSGRAGFVLAVVSRRTKDGCTTFVDCLARTLRDRGTDAVTTEFDRIDPDCGIVQIVDAGSWFGSGPIRRERATTLARDCDAAILLRRADRSTAAAFARALAVAGVRVLGEVTTFGRSPATELEATT